MTASRRKYTLPLINQFNLAGQRLGLDLAGLFEEDEDGNAGLGGFVPAFTTRTLNKSRGNVLSYRPQPRSSSVTEFSLTPEADTSTRAELPGGPVQDTDTETPKQPDNRFDELTSLARDYGQTSLFGAMDYVKAKEQGFSDEDIEGYLRANPNMLAEQNRQGKIGGLFEQIARGAVDTSTATPRDWALQNQNYKPTEQSNQAFRTAQSYENAPKISTAFGQDSRYFGGEDLAAARQSGYSDSDIRSFLEDNLNLLRGGNRPGGNEEIGQMLKDLAPQAPSGGGGGGGGGSQPAPQSSKGQDIGFSAVGSTPGSEDWFGGADIRQALNEGATIADIQRAAKTYSDQGKTRGGMAPGGEFYERLMRGDLSFAQ